MLDKCNNKTTTTNNNNKQQQKTWHVCSRRSQPKQKWRKRQHVTLHVLQLALKERVQPLRNYVGLLRSNECCVSKDNQKKNRQRFEHRQAHSSCVVALQSLYERQRQRVVANQLTNSFLTFDHRRPLHDEAASTDNTKERESPRTCACAWSVIN